MFLIQNLSCIPISFKGKEVKLPLSNSLKDKFIHQCFILSSEEDCVILSPYNGVMLTQLFDNEHLYFSLSVNDDNRHEINNAFFSIRNYNVHFSPHTINRSFQSEKSFFYSESTFENAGANTSIYFTWGEKLKTSFDQKTSHHIEYKLVRDENTITFLSDILDKSSIEGKKIKKIRCTLNASYSPAYLDIVCKDGRKIEYIPASLLQLSDEFEIFFDDIEIDLDKSRFLIPTFNEKEYAYTIRFDW
ncbi:MAG: hypothetical protein QM751_00935 [Paludibacteraceae bacterium]